MKQTITLILFLIISNLSFSQYAYKMRQYHVKKGYIFKDGQQTDGYFQIADEIVSYSNRPYKAPWNFQYKIRFIPKQKFEQKSKIIPADFTVYTPKDIDGYVYDGQLYVSVKFTDYSIIEVENYFHKYKFMQVIDDGKFQLLAYYSSPEGNRNDKILSDCSSYPEYYYRRGNGKVKFVNALNVRKEMADCPEVIYRFKHGAYFSDNYAMNAPHTDIRTQNRFNAILDYNRTCGENNN